MPDPLARASVEPSPDASTSADASVCIPAPGSETHLNTHPLAKIDKSGTILTLTLTLTPTLTLTLPKLHPDYFVASPACSL